MICVKCGHDDYDSGEINSCHLTNIPHCGSCHWMIAKEPAPATNPPQAHKILSESEQQIVLLKKICDLLASVREKLDSANGWLEDIDGK